MNIGDTTDVELEDALAAAASAAAPLRESRLDERGAMLRAIADALDEAADALIPLAREETSLAEQRLQGELARTTAQLRMFDDVLAEGSFVGAMIDTADHEKARPDLRRMLWPVGPVLVFAAGNFPFAFSVAGGDTASALAAGCPVVLKAHPGHPRLSRRTGDVVSRALSGAGAPEGAFTVLFGTETGTTALGDARIQAGAFTGSLSSGRLLFDIANSRHDPIPFYGEMGSLNPVFVTPGAASTRGEVLAREYVQSYTLGSGQFCTKPGLLLLPRGHGLEESLKSAVRSVSALPMLNDDIYRGYDQELTRLATHHAVQTMVGPARSEADAVAPTLLWTTLDQLVEHGEDLLTECFGPTSLIVEYRDEAQLVPAAQAIGGNLVATVHGEDDEIDLVSPLLDELSRRAGRLVWNGWPTGVAVTWAMHHGGPYPATTGSLHTSVGATAARRFMRPVCFQDMPQTLLPDALHDENPLHIPRRINGGSTS